MRRGSIRLKAIFAKLEPPGAATEMVAAATG
jgi:hypothetical protein